MFHLMNKSEDTTYIPTVYGEDQTLTWVWTDQFEDK